LCGWSSSYVPLFTSTHCAPHFFPNICFETNFRGVSLGAAKLDSYAALGGLAFMEDYFAVAPSIAKEFRASEELKMVLAELAGDWRKTNTDYVRNLSVTTDTDFDAVGKNLRETFNGAKVYPNVVDRLFAVTRQSVLSKDLTRALKASHV
jgi:hypothetical protein